MISIWKISHFYLRPASRLSSLKEILFSENWSLSVNFSLHRLDVHSNKSVYLPTASSQRVWFNKNPNQCREIMCNYLQSNRFISCLLLGERNVRRGWGSYVTANLFWPSTGVVEMSKMTVSEIIICFLMCFIQSRTSQHWDRILPRIKHKLLPFVS